jgi:hypothetical protein
MPRSIYTFVDTAALARRVKWSRFDHEIRPVMSLLPANNYPRSAKYKQARPASTDWRRVERQFPSAINLFPTSNSQNPQLNQTMKSNQRILGQTSAAALLVAATTVMAFTTASLWAASPERPASAAAGSAPSGQSIPWSDLGAKATAQYSGDGLTVCAGKDGAVRLRCTFQLLEGEVTSEGLWLTSTVEGNAADRFRVVADYVGRDGGAMVALPEHDAARLETDCAQRGTFPDCSKVMSENQAKSIVSEPSKPAMESTL